MSTAETYAHPVADSARDIENLLYTYAERIDLGDLDGVAALFEHAVIYGQENGPPETQFVGVEGARKMYGMSTRLYEDDGTPKTKHITTNAIIHVDDEAQTATSRSYYCVIQATPAFPLQPIIAGRYHDTFQVVDGAWWFASRTLFVDLMGDLSQHLKW
ncbi:MAG: Ring hydroxylating enzyme beta subunit [Marmoricola sp.]|nr:Ring hydroxylating enzyme beta subunit [Marmoricola sp.]